MRVLISIFTSNLYAGNGICQAQRDTWLKDVSAVENLDYKFFMGRGEHPLDSDEVRLDNVGDGHENSSPKTVEIRRWALNAGYEHVFLCANDTYVRPERLMASGFEQYDYVGYPISNGGGANIEGHFDLCSGGAGYWTSKQVMEDMVNTPITDSVEDRWTGEVVRSSGLFLTPDMRYNCFAVPYPLKSNDIITCHLSVRTGEYDVQQMYWTHEQWVNS